MEFHKRIKEYLDNKGVKDKEVAKLLGYSDSMMSRYVNAPKPNIEFVDRLIKLYPDADLNWLLKDEDQLQQVAEQRAIYTRSSTVLIEEIESKLVELKKFMSQI